MKLNNKLSKSIIGLACCVSILGGSVAVYAAELQSEPQALLAQADMDAIVAIADEPTIDLVENIRKEAIAEEKARMEQEAQKAAEKAAKEEAEKAAKAEEARMTKRQEVVDYALQFVGNPYVYGGTS